MAPPRLSAELPLMEVPVIVVAMLSTMIAPPFADGAELPVKVQLLTVAVALPRLTLARSSPPPPDEPEFATLLMNVLFWIVTVAEVLAPRAATAPPAVPLELGSVGPRPPNTQLSMSRSPPKFCTAPPPNPGLTTVLFLNTQFVMVILPRVA